VTAPLDAKEKESHVLTRRPDSPVERDSNHPGRSARVAHRIVPANAAPEGSVIVAMLPATGERYLSTALFEGVETGSDEL
jgi:hypothetical protein